MNERLWYFARNNQQEGPLHESQLKQLIRLGEIPQDTLVWTEGMAGWTPAFLLSDFNFGRVLVGATTEEHPAFSQNTTTERPAYKNPGDLNPTGSFAPPTAPEEMEAALKDPNHGMFKQGGGELEQEPGVSQPSGSTGHAEASTAVEQSNLAFDEAVNRQPSVSANGSAEDEQGYQHPAMQQQGFGADGQGYQHPAMQQQGFDADGQGNQHPVVQHHGFAEDGQGNQHPLTEQPGFAEGGQSYQHPLMQQQGFAEDGQGYQHPLTEQPGFAEGGQGYQHPLTQQQGFADDGQDYQHPAMREPGLGYPEQASELPTVEEPAWGSSPYGHESDPYSPAAATEQASGLPPSGVYFDPAVEAFMKGQPEVATAPQAGPGGQAVVHEAEHDKGSLGERFQQRSQDGDAAVRSFIKRSHTEEVDAEEQPDGDEFQQNRRQSVSQLRSRFQKGKPHQSPAQLEEAASQQKAQGSRSFIDRALGWFRKDK